MFQKKHVEIQTLQKAQSLLSQSEGEGGEGPSVFECQLRIFDKWFRQWTEEDKRKFVAMVAEVDPQNVAQQRLS